METKLTEEMKTEIEKLMFVYLIDNLVLSRNGNSVEISVISPSGHIAFIDSVVVTDDEC